MHPGFPRRVLIPQCNHEECLLFRIVFIWTISYIVILYKIDQEWKTLQKEFLRRSPGSGHEEGLLRALVFSGSASPNFSCWLCLRCSLPGCLYLSLHSARAMTCRTGGNEAGTFQGVLVTPKWPFQVDTCITMNKLILQASDPCPSDSNRQRTLSCGGEIKETPRFWMSC